LIQSHTEGPNLILLYNIAAVAYQKQQYGRALSFVNQILATNEYFEEFLLVKSLFLLLQIFYELRQVSPALYLIRYLESKITEFESTVSQKQKIRNLQGHEDEEQKSGFTETLDEQTLNRNSYCIVAGAYVRKHGISPKNANISEYKFLLSAYQAFFTLLENPEAQIDLAPITALKEQILTDPVKFNP